MDIVLGRTHNPFSGVAERWIQPPEHPNAGVVAKILDNAHDDAVEVEWKNGTATVRPLRRTLQAALKIGLERYRTGVSKASQILNEIPFEVLRTAFDSSKADTSKLETLGTGLAAAYGIASGKAVTSADRVAEVAASGEPVILVVTKTTPEDMTALEKVAAIVTTTGGYTSHSAVVARQMGKPCIVGATLSDSLNPNQWITVDGGSGTVFNGKAEITKLAIDPDFEYLLAAASAECTMKVFANADTPEDVKAAIANGAAGIGLCRTEHTFFTPNGVAIIRRVILAKSAKEKALASADLLAYQRKHFEEVFENLGPRPVVVRLLDPPLHEFLPKETDKKAISAVAKSVKMPAKKLRERILELHEENPMLGHRGCRLGITWPQLYATQVHAIVLAAQPAYQNSGAPSELGIMVPLIVDPNELKTLVSSIRSVVTSVLPNYPDPDQLVPVSIGAMIETPRACLKAGELADVCDFFSFGTNDLTQMTWALSRDDSTKFMREYASKGVITQDPFVSLDSEGVGLLMAHAIESLNSEQRVRLKIGICGEHGGDPSSIEFCKKLNLDYVSCSPSRIPLARLAVVVASGSTQKPEIVTIDVPAAPATMETQLNPTTKLKILPIPSITSLPETSGIDQLTSVPKTAATASASKAAPLTNFDFSTKSAVDMAKGVAGMYVLSNNSFVPWGRVVGVVDVPPTPYLVVDLGDNPVGHDGGHFKPFIYSVVPKLPKKGLWLLKLTEIIEVKSTKPDAWNLGGEE